MSTRPRKRQRRLSGLEDSSDSETEQPTTEQQELARRSKGPRLLQQDSSDSSDGEEDEVKNNNGRVLGEEEDDEDGEDLEENAEKDYRAIPELDRYDAKDIDHDDYDPISQDARRAAEQFMGQRDREQSQRGVRLPGALQDSDGDDDSDDEEAARRRYMRERVEYAAEENYNVPDPVAMDLQNFNVPLNEWIKREEVRHEVKRRFAEFLRTFKRASERQPAYVEKVRAMCASNLQSLLVSYRDLMQQKTLLAVWLADAPKEMLKLFDVVAKDLVLEHFPEYDEIHDSIYVRISELPIVDELRNLRTTHLNVLVKVTGVVTRRTQVVPEIKTAVFKCKECSEEYIADPTPIGEGRLPDVPKTCGMCEKENTYELNLAKTVYRSFQMICLQESPGTVPAGRVPRYKNIYVSGDLIDLAKPGEEVEITGIYENILDNNLNNQNGFPVFNTRIMANYIRKQEDLNGHISISEDDKLEMIKMAKDPRIAERIIGSIAPSVYGHQHMKTALAMSLFGGREKATTKHRIRGDINVLLMGDPGTAKSQCLKYAEKTAPRAVYTTGKGASAVGLTAAVQKDPITREWTLEGGALVLADKGVCLIDEFDKMNDKDRTSIHEAMEQQSISISKAGIITTLQARCSIIAAANPIGGRYDSQKTFAENVELTDPILQRFDVLCVLRDTVDPMVDERLAKFVLGSHIRAHPAFDETDPAMNDESIRVDMNDNEPPGGFVDQEMLKKYILYARSLKPQLHAINQEKIDNLYVELRRESVKNGGVPIATRHIESILRMSEAFARIHLREHVRDDDVDMAIQVILNSFISAQKFSVQKSMKRTFQKYITYKKDHNDLLMHILEEVVKDQVYFLGLVEKDETKVEILMEDFESRARELGVHDLSAFYACPMFKKRKFSLATNENRKKVIIKDF